MDWIERSFTGLDEEYVRGAYDGRHSDSPPPSDNRHPAYRHAWEVARAEVMGEPIPAAWSRTRVAHIEQGGDFYPWFKEASDGL